MGKHIVVELPTGDWAEVPEGATLKLYLFNDESMAEVANGAAPDSVQAIHSMHFDVGLDLVEGGGVEVIDADEG